MKTSRRNFLKGLSSLGVLPFLKKAPKVESLEPVSVEQEAEELKPFEPLQPEINKRFLAADPAWGCCSSGYGPMPAYLSDVTLSWMPRVEENNYYRTVLVVGPSMREPCEYLERTWHYAVENGVRADCRRNVHGVSKLVKGGVRYVAVDAWQVDAARGYDPTTTTLIMAPSCRPYPWQALELLSRYKKDPWSNWPL